MKIIEPISLVLSDIAYGDFLLQPDAESLLVEEAKRFQVSAVSTNVPEDDYPPWDPDHGYEVGERCIRDKRVWEAVTESQGVEPGNETEQPARWFSPGYTNRWRAFDESVGTVTEHPESIEYSISLGQGVDSLGFFGADAASIRVRVVDPYRGVVFELTEAPVKTDHIDNWYAYFFSEIVAQEDLVITGIPRSPFGAIAIQIIKPNGIAKIGALVAGRIADLGVARYGTSVGIIDHSRKVTNEFGHVMVLERGFSKRAEYDVSVDTDRVSRVQRTLARWRAKPVVWIGASHIEATIIFGYFRDFSIYINGPEISEATISVEGLTT